MKISLITVSFNSEETIVDTLCSVFRQKDIDLEYIIIDGNSSDSTLKLIEAYKDKVDILISEPDKGIYDAMNKGLKKASGDIIGILNSDDVFAHDEVLKNVCDLFNDQSLEAVYGDLVYVDRFDIKKIKRKWISGAYQTGSFKKGWMPPHPTFYVRKEVYDNYGLFNLALKSSADYEIMLRFIHKHKIKLAYLPEIMVKMRQGGQSNVSLRNRVKANKEDRLAWEINGLKPGPLTLIRKPISKISQFIKK